MMEDNERAWLRENLSELKIDMKSGFSEVRRDLTEIKTQVAVLETDMKNMNDSRTNEATERKQIEKRVSDLESNLSGFKGKFVGMVTVGAAFVSLLVTVILKFIGL
jgi:septal ring factor EnvC (AmiA/AmiB activator)